MIKSFTEQCNNPLLAGIVFNNNFENATDLSYKIRLANTKRRFREFGQGIQPWDTKVMLFSPLVFAGPVGPTYATGGAPGYWVEGFLSLQHAIHLSVMDVKSFVTTPDIFSDLLNGRVMQVGIL